MTHVVLEDLIKILADFPMIQLYHVFFFLECIRVGFLLLLICCVVYLTQKSVVTMSVNVIYLYVLVDMQDNNK